ncbi:hypothetical protein GCM10017562_72800 [Streptomyces roseofulvus]
MTASAELASWRVRTAWTTFVIRVVEQRSSRRRRQDLRVAMACSTRARIFRMGPVHRLLARGQGLPPPPAPGADRAAGTSVALVGPARDVGLGEGIDNAVFAGRADVVDGAGQAGETHATARRDR